MAEKLTAQQKQAVENQGGKLLVSAAAGSGKTKVLVDRLMRYILDPGDPANIDDFLIITYTKAAAAELRGKIAAKLSELIAAAPTNRHLQQQMQRLYLAKISTVHGFCTDVLRQYAYRLDITSDFRVADESECAELQLKALAQTLDNAYENAEADEDFRTFVDTQGLGRDDKLIPQIILKVYASAKCHPNSDEWLDQCTSSASADASGAEETPWGAYLIADLKAYLALQIDAIGRCAAAAAKADGMEKPAALLAATADQLRRLYDCETWDEIVDHKDIQYGTLTFSKKCTDLQLVDQIKAVRSACKEGLNKRLRNFVDSSEQLLSDILQTASAARGLVNLVKAFDIRYSCLKKNRGVVDFADLEHYALDLLLGKQRNAATVIAAEVGAQFREIMVDEYQDSNEIQDAIFNALTEKRQNCFMVGDVKQSIYQFRLADPSIFINKYNTYRSVDEAVPREGRRVLLNHNFRSSAGVIEAVNDVFGHCMSSQVGGLDYGEAEMLREGIPHIPLQEPEVSLYGIEVENDTYAEEAAFVADKICELLDGSHYVRNGETLRPITPDDIVILLRSPGSVGGEFRFALQSRGVRCYTGDQGDLLQTEEITTIRAILEVINNPLQDIPLTAVLTSPVFGYTAEDLALLRSKDRSADIYTLIASAGDEKSLAFKDTFTALRQTARLSGVTGLISAVYSQTNLLSIYSAMPNGAERLNNLQTFFQLASDYENTGPKELSSFLEHLSALEERGLPGSSQQTSGGVTVMSIHKSKGLEFPVVFLCGLSRGFNQESARGQVLCDKDLGLGLACVDAKLRVRYSTLAKQAISVKTVRESVSEELRVLYVAMTRARDRLIMTYADKKLAEKLQNIAMRLDLSDRRLLSAEVDCPGDWVLQTALTRTEAGAFFALGGHPDCADVRKRVWEIAVVRAAETQAASVSETNEQQILPDVIEKLSNALSLRYGHISATKIPSKLTATQLKGRTLDDEIVDGSVETVPTVFRKPGPVTRNSGKTYGNATHTVLQYISFNRCNTVNEIQAELDRLVAERRITREQADMVDCGKIAVFFATPVGRKLQESKDLLREYKFSVLEDAARFYPDAVGEQILFQGVVDCAIVEDDGITVLDFKTDYVTEETLETVAGKYRAQVLSYAGALSRIYRMPVKSAKLYFFALDRFVDVI